MKKIALFLMAFAAIAMTSCQPGGPKDVDHYHFINRNLIGATLEEAGNALIKAGYTYDAASGQAAVAGVTTSFMDIPGGIFATENHVCMALGSIALSDGTVRRVTCTRLNTIENGYAYSVTQLSLMGKVPSVGRTTCGNIKCMIMGTNDQSMMVSSPTSLKDYIAKLIELQAGKYDTFTVNNMTATGADGAFVSYSITTAEKKQMTTTLTMSLLPDN